MSESYITIDSLTHRYSLPIDQVFPLLIKFGIHVEVIDDILSISKQTLKTLDTLIAETQKEVSILHSVEVETSEEDLNTEPPIEVYTPKGIPYTQMKLGQILLLQGLITENDLEKALAIQERRGGILGQILINMGIIMEEEVLLAVAIQTNMPLLTNLEEKVIDQVVIDKVPSRIAHQFHIVPVQITNNNKLLIATDQPQNKDMIEDIKKLIRDEFEMCVASSADIEEVLQKIYSINEIKNKGTSSICTTTKIDSSFPIANKLVRNWFSQDLDLGKRVFLAMPFSIEFESVFDIIIQSCEFVKARVLRVDLIPNLRNIWRSIEREIKRADILIADFTGDKYPDIPNPNVITEATIAYHKYEMPVIVITQNRESLFFDWRQQFAIKYVPTEEGFLVLKRHLINRLEAEMAQIDIPNIII